MAPPLIALKQNKPIEQVQHGTGQNISFFHILPRVLNRIKDAYDFVNDNERVKVLNVRHPVERLFSAWGQKFSKSHYSVNAYRRRFIKSGMIRPAENSNSSIAATPDTHICSFPDFIQYWLTFPEKNYNKHWHSILHDCLPCTIKYDYITKLETVEEDSKRVVGRLYPESRKHQSQYNHFRLDKSTSTKYI